jgi:peptidyl-prolyl cis-trans isomerase C
MLLFRLRLAVTTLRRLFMALGLGLSLIAGVSAQPAPAPIQPAPHPAASPAPSPSAAPSAAPATPATPQAAGAATGTAADPVLAKVNGQPIRLSDLQNAVKELPATAHNMPPATLYPMLLQQMIDGRALSIEADKAGLQNGPAVQRQIAAATQRVLQTAMLGQVIGPMITEDALRARYQRDYATKPGEDEVHARHILVDNEDLAKKIIAQLKAGGDFAALAKQYSKDPSGDQSGDLGFFKKDEMVPEFAAAAFAMKPGQLSDTPVHTQFGWHVIQVLERRHSDPPTFEQVHDELRQNVIQEGVKKALADARSRVSVEEFNLDGSPKRATDTAEPPPAPKP